MAGAGWFNRRAAESKLSELATRVQAEHLKVCGAASAMLEHALEAGRALIEAKKLCLKGAWKAWVAYKLLDRLRCFRANLMSYRSGLSELSG